MKRILFILIFIIVTIIIFITARNLFFEKPITDFTNISDNNLFMTSLIDYYHKEYDSFFYLNESVGAKADNYCLFNVIDENNKPIKDAEIEFYDTFNNSVILKTNQEGYVGISNLQKKIYKFRLLNYNNELKKVDLKEENCNFTLKNKEIINNKISQTPLQSEEIKEKDASILKYYKNEYIFLKKELKGEKLTIINSRELGKYDDFYVEYYFQISNAVIKSIEVENIDSNDIKILSLDKKEQTKFQDDKGFYISGKDDEEFSNTKVNVIITFNYHNKLYKIKKEITLGYETTLGYIYINNTLPSSYSILSSLDLKTGKETFVKEFDYSHDYSYRSSLGFGNYVFKTYVDDKLYSTNYFEIKNGKLTMIEIG